MMDTKALVIGQYVRMISGCYGNAGKVVKVTPWGVAVQTTAACAGTVIGELLYFDQDGKACDSNGKPYMWRWFRDPWSWAESGIPGTFECGLWELTDDEQAAKDFEQAMARNREHVAELRRNYEARKNNAPA